MMNTRQTSNLGAGSSLGKNNWGGGRVGRFSLLSLLLSNKPPCQNRFRSVAPGSSSPATIEHNCTIFSSPLNGSVPNSKFVRENS